MLVAGGQDISPVFDFHHKDGEKDFSISSSTNRSWALVAKELKKCELLCALCHRVEHSGERDAKFMAAVDAMPKVVFELG